MIFLLIATVFAHKTFLHDWDNEWVDFKRKFSKTYETVEEDAKRFRIYMDNVVLADSYNAEEQETATHGITKFMDLRYEEMPLGYKASVEGSTLPQWDGKTCTTCKQFPNLSGATPASIDWTKLGAVNPIKDQAQCGSCWTFSTVVGVEGAEFMATGVLKSYSEEEIVQCASSAGQGCQGGSMDLAYKWIMSNGGLDTEDDYPYTSGTGTTGTCNTRKEKKNEVSITGAWNLGSGSGSADDEKNLVSGTAHTGPLSIAVNAGRLQTYQGGVLDPLFCSPSKLDHGVAIVGYGTDNGKDYWKVRNSWGKTWGEDGYFRIVRGKNACGVAMDVSVGYINSGDKREVE